MTIFTRQTATTDKDSIHARDRDAAVMVEHSWKYVLAIARDQLDDIDAIRDQSAYTDENRHRLLSHQMHDNAFYDRERLMIQALDTLFSITCDGAGYVTFVTTMVQLLDPDCPVSMAFLSHVIDRATLPSKNTMSCVSPAILSQVDTKCSKNYHQHDFIHGKKWTTWMTQRVSAISAATTRRKRQLPTIEAETETNTKRKRNAVVIWALLAEKFAGEMVHLLWTPEVGKFLLRLLSDTQENWKVRVFALLALEMFALTGDIKIRILQHPFQIQTILQQAVDDSLHGYYYSEDDCTGVPLPPVTITNTSQSTLSCNTGIPAFCRTLRKYHRQPCMKLISCCVRKLAKRKSETTQHDGNLLNLDSYMNEDDMNTSRNQNIGLRESHLQLDRINNIQEIHHHFDREQLWRTDSDATVLAANGNIDDQYDDEDGDVSCFALTEPDENYDEEDKNSHRISDTWWKENSYDEWHADSTVGNLSLNPASVGYTKRLELTHCARWSLENVFSGKKDGMRSLRWDLAGLNVIVNPFDATQYWKLGGNGLELRNDRLHFESIRATAGVKRGRWYYEALLVTEGIMQIGWCTKQCRFVPEEGYGVGDDRHGFAFDTYRVAVWANGSTVYPPQYRSHIRCHAGDVLGSYLDMEQGICSFYINGNDLGLTVAFEQASSTTTNDVNGELFPAFSLTTHQHIIINFGDKPWMYIPKNLLSIWQQQDGWKGINQAGAITDEFRRRVYDWQERGTLTARTIKRSISSSAITAAVSKKRSTGGHEIQKKDACMNEDSGNDSNNNGGDEDGWDGPLCMMCFNEPKEIDLVLSCGHGGWGSNCAKLLTTCPLCRTRIEGASSLSN